MKAHAHREQEIASKDKQFSICIELALSFSTNERAGKQKAKFSIDAVIMCKNK